MGFFRIFGFSGNFNFSSIISHLRISQVFLSSLKSPKVTSKSCVAFSKRDFTRTHSCLPFFNSSSSLCLTQTSPPNNLECSIFITDSCFFRLVISDLRREQSSDWVATSETLFTPSITGEGSSWGKEETPGDTGEREGCKLSSEWWWVTESWENIFGWGRGELHSLETVGLLRIGPEVCGRLIEGWRRIWMSLSDSWGKRGRPVRSWGVKLWN